MYDCVRSDCHFITRVDALPAPSSKVFMSLKSRIDIETSSQNKEAPCPKTNPYFKFR